MSLQADNPKQLQTDSSKVDSGPKEQPTFQKSNDHPNPPPYPIIPASSVPVNPEPPTLSDADQPLPSLSTLHAQLKKIAEKYICCHRQIVAAGQVLRKDFDIGFKSRRRVLTFIKLEPTLLKLINALTELDEIQWTEFPFKPLQRSTTSDIGKVLQDLDSFAGEVNKLLEYLRFLAFHAELVWKDATQLIGPQAPDAIYLQQVCQRLKRRVKGVNTLLTGEATE
jgi:hypothetical protein